MLSEQSPSHTNMIAGLPRVIVQDEVIATTVRQTNKRLVKGSSNGNGTPTSASLTL
jgi:hypothetical protein